MHGLSDAVYKLPMPEELRELLRRHDLTGGQAGRLVGVDSRTVRRWTGGDRRMPWAAWTLLRLLVGETTAEEVLAKMGEDGTLPED